MVMKRYFVRVTKTYWSSLDRQTDQGVRNDFRKSRLMPVGYTPSDTDLELTADADPEIVGLMRSQGFDVEQATVYRK